jgi:crossover junction endodeoxyribonuclease RusA
VTNNDTTGRDRSAAPPRARDGAAPDDYRLALPYDRPPLTANQRHHWRPRARLVAAVRSTTATLARSANVPALGRCSVRLVWTVTDRRRRDVDNLVPTLKACADGLVDAGVVVDDVPALMAKHMPEIVLGEQPSLVLIVEPLGGAL